MEEDKVIGRAFSSVTLAELGEDGFWKVTSDMKEGRLVEGKEWEYRKIEAEAMDKDVQIAYESALISVASEFKKKLVDAGFESMFDISEEELHNGGEQTEALSN